MERDGAFAELCRDVRDVLALLEVATPAQKRSALFQEVRARLVGALRVAERSVLS